MASVVNDITQNSKEAILAKIIDEKIAICNNTQDFINFLSSKEITQVAAGINPKSMALILLAKALPALDFADQTPGTNFYVESINALLNSPDIDLTVTMQDGQNAVVLFIEAASEGDEHKLALLNTLLAKLQAKAEAQLLTPLYTPIQYKDLPTEFNALSLALNYKNKNLIAVLSNYITDKDQRRQLLARLLADDDNYQWALLMAWDKNWLTARDKGAYLLNAIDNSRIMTVTALLDRDADLNYSSPIGMQKPPLMVAASYNDVDMVKLLINRGANVRQVYQPKTIYGTFYETALTIACENRHIELVEVLCNNGALSDSDDIIVEKTINIAFITAASCGYTDIVSFLLAHRDYRAFFNEALLHAARQGHIATAVLLLDNGADINTSPLNIITRIDNFETGTTPLILAAINGQEDMVNLLLERGALLERTTQYNDTALTRAAAYGSTAIVRMLLDRGANIAHTEIGERNAFVLAAVEGHYATVALLANRGNYTLENDRASIEHALMAATQKGFINIVRYLVNLYNYDNLNELLARAAYNYDTNIMEFLLYKGADINKVLDAVIAANAVATALEHLQYEQSGITILQWFIDHGAQFSRAHYNRAFWLAVLNGQVKLLNFLIDKGADINFVWDNQKTLLENALEIAFRRKSKSISHQAMFARLSDLEKIHGRPILIVHNAPPPRSFLPSISSLASIGQKAVNVFRSMCPRQ